MNFCFQALVEKGWIKMQDLLKIKLRYAHLTALTELTKKSKFATEFLKNMMVECEVLQAEIDSLRTGFNFKVCCAKRLKTQ